MPTVEALPSSDPQKLCVVANTPVIKNLPLLSSSSPSKLIPTVEAFPRTNDGGVSCHTLKDLMHNINAAMLKHETKIVRTLYYIIYGKKEIEDKNLYDDIMKWIKTPRKVCKGTHVSFVKSMTHRLYDNTSDEDVVKIGIMLFGLSDDYVTVEKYLDEISEIVVWGQYSNVNRFDGDHDDIKVQFYEDTRDGEKFPKKYKAFQELKEWGKHSNNIDNDNGNDDSRFWRLNGFTDDDNHKDNDNEDNNFSFMLEHR